MIYITIELFYIIFQTYIFIKFFENIITIGMYKYKPNLKFYKTNLEGFIDRALEVMRDENEF